MIRLTEKDWRIFRRLQRKHNVSTEFLRYNLENIEKFIWYETWPRIVIKRYAIRKNNRVFIIYYRLRRVLFDQCNRKLFKRMRQNIKQWSKRMVAHLKTNMGIAEYVEEVVWEKKKDNAQETVQTETVKSLKNSDDVSKQLKEQLKLLKSGRRLPPLISSTKRNDTTLETTIDQMQMGLEEEVNFSKYSEKHMSDNDISGVRGKLKEQLNSLKSKKDVRIDLNITPPTHREWQINLESTPEKQLTTQENLQPIKLLATDEKTEKSHAEDDNSLPSLQQTEKVKTGFNFLDMLMSKVTASSSGSNNPSGSLNKSAEKSKDDSLTRMSSSTSLKESLHHQDHSMDSTDGFLGFDDCERIPGMLMTPIVPHSTKNNKNSVFISESLNEYMRANDLETNYSIDEDKSIIKGKIHAQDMEGLMTLKTIPPHFDMPAVPENLLKFRTVAERKQYLQKFSKNSRLAIINNEASIYRELQRRMRTQKVKSASQQLAQSPNSSMSFTRNGWKAASFINTEFNKYYYQTIDVDYGLYKVRLRGARGNNNEFRKKPYISRVIKPSNECPYQCADEIMWQNLKAIKTVIAKSKKLNKDPLPSVFKPCPLSHKTFQKPLDDDAAALLLAGGSMAVVRMPTVELEVFPEFGRPLHEIAKRYLQYILPHHDISREWAEFSVSTLQQPKSLKEAEQAAAKSFSSKDIRKSYTFVIPYLNDRNHILVRRVVDRSEKLDDSFENSLEEKELVPKHDFSFRQNLDKNDKDLLICADVVSDMINTVAISCSENSFIKHDPDVINIADDVNDTDKRQTKLDGNCLETQLSSSPNTTAAALGNVKKQKKQNSLLLELKRLNATIIDAAIKTESDDKPCSKAYCQMGCICASLAEDLPMREHCGKSKCMLECTCKSSGQSRIMRLETDGRTITTEDAFMLRRKATARLARMEKEFTSTVVLTENETLLINETNNDKKRRCTKAPKRYEDFTDTEDEQRKNTPKKTALTTIDNGKHLAVEIKEIRDPVYVKDTILEQLKHCTVNLVPLQDMDNIAPWCMVHNLYKCFCKGRAVEGKPIVIEKEEVNSTIDHDSSEQSLELEKTANTKPKYTFDKVEKGKKSVVQDDDDTDDDDNNDDDDNSDDDDNNDDDDEDDDEGEKYDKDDQMSTDNKKYQSDDNYEWIKRRNRKRKYQKEKLMRKKITEEIKSDDNSSNRSSKTSDDESQHNSVQNVYRAKSLVKNLVEKNKSKPSLHEVRTRFYQAREDSCRREIPIPRRMFLYCNRKRRLNVLKFIKENENEQTRLLLNEHVMRSVYYHKIDAETQKKNDQVMEKEKKEDNVEKNRVETQKRTRAEQKLETENSVKPSFPVNEIVYLLDDDDDDEGGEEEKETKEACDLKLNTANEKDENSQLTSSSTISCTSFEKSMPGKELADSTSSQAKSSSDKIITVKQFATLSTENTEDSGKELQTINPQNESIESPSECDNAELKLPKIASCFSLNVKANSQKNSANTSPNGEQENLDFTSATSVNSAAFSQNNGLQPKLLTNPSTIVSTTSTKADEINTTVVDMNNENIKDVYNSVIRTMNSLVSKKMQDIDCALQRESNIIPTPNADILCIMKWTNFLDAFCEGFAYVWQVKVKDFTFFVVTICNMMPLIAGAMGIVNITALKPDKMPLIGKMLLQRFRNKETAKLAVVLQGKQSHWVVKGFLKADPLLACNKPTPESHPSLTKKINILCSLLVKQRQRDQRKKNVAHWASPQMAMATKPPISTTTQTTVTQQVAPKVAQIMPIRRMATVQPPAVINLSTSVSAPQIDNSLPLKQSINQIINTPPEMCSQSSLDARPKSIKVNIVEGEKKANSKNTNRKRKIDTSSTASNNLLKADSYSKMNSNIEFRSVSQHDISEIFLPEINKMDHKWLVLDLHNDFSHIFVPDFRDLVSLDRIQKVINFARQKNKIVKLQFFQNAPFDAFVTPKSTRKIYFGPLAMEMKAPTLILLQSVDGQMMLRELYQIQHNIVKKAEEKTKAFWLIHVKGQTHFEMDVSISNEITSEQQVSTAFAISPVAPPPTPPLPAITTTSQNNVQLSINANASNLVEKKKSLQENNGDDDDCMIIDDDSEQNVESTIQDRYNFTIKTSLIDNTTVSITPQANSLPGPLPIQTLKTFKTSNTDSLMLPPAAPQSLLKVPNTNTIITPVNPAISVNPVILNASHINATNAAQLPILALPPNTVITGINPTSTPVSNIGTSLMSLPTNAVITGIKPAPPDAPYSSTIFITSSAPSPISATPTALDVATTTSTTTINNTTIVSTSREQHQLPQEKTTNENKSDKNAMKQTADTNQTSFEAAGAIKRRRISLFCPNKYDKISENLAVDAVIKNILPDNSEYIQIKPLVTTVANDNTIRTTTSTTTTTTTSTTMMSVPKVMATGSATKISKINNTESNNRYENETVNKTTKEPIVFDVNFMDDGDEPTASIVIKPTTPTSTNQTNSTTLSLPAQTTCSNAVQISQTTNTKENNESITTTTNASFDAYKSIKLPTLFNTPTAAVATSVNNPGKGKYINSLLCSKQQPNIVPKFSSPRLIYPKPPITASTTSTSTSISTTTSSSIRGPFIIKNASMPVKIQKILTTISGSVTLQCAKPITTISSMSAAVNNTDTTTKQSASLATLTVQEVQAMLNKSGLNVTSTTSSAVTAVTTSANMQLNISPYIKAKIMPAKVSTISTSAESLSTSIAPASSSSAATSKDNVVPNSTITISKVQSFGSPPQKNQNSNSEKKVTASVPPPQGQQAVGASEISSKRCLPIPPSHIQYGYIVSSSYANQKFVAKRVAEEFYVKVPSVGILKLQGLGAVNTYLNKYINKTLKEAHPTQVVWHFLAASKAVQVQNHQKLLLVRKTKTPIGSLGFGKGRNTIGNKTATTTTDSSLNEPILIDD